MTTTDATTPATITAAVLDATVKQVFEAAAEEGLQKIGELDPDLGRDRLRRKLDSAWHSACLTPNSTRLGVARALGLLGTSGWSERVGVSRIRASIKRVAATADYSFKMHRHGTQGARTEMVFAGTASERLYSAHRAAEESAGLESETRRAIAALESVMQTLASEDWSVDADAVESDAWHGEAVRAAMNVGLKTLKNRLARITNPGENER